MCVTASGVKRLDLERVAMIFADLASVVGIVPGGWKINPEDDAENPILELMDGAYLVQATEFTETVNSLMGEMVVTRAALFVSEVVYIPGSYWEPGDWDVRELGAGPALSEVEAACRIVMDLVGKMLEAATERYCQEFT